MDAAAKVSKGYQGLRENAVWMDLSNRGKGGGQPMGGAPSQYLGFTCSPNNLLIGNIIRKRVSTEGSTNGITHDGIKAIEERRV